MRLRPRRLAAPGVGSLLASRQGSLLLALLCAVVAAALLLFALSRFKESIAKPVPQATVLVATGRVVPGMSGEQLVTDHLYKSTPVTATQLAPGAISDAAQLATATASATVLPGQQLTAADFSTIVGADQALNAGQRGIEVTVSESPGAVDITQAGSRVDVYTTPPSGSSRPAELIAADVKVLKPASPAPVTIGNQVVAGSSLVLALPDATVPTVIKDSQSLYLVLRPATHPAAPSGGSS